MARRTKAQERQDAERLTAAIAPSLRIFQPPKDQTVSDWAEDNRHLSPETSAEPGPWRTSRTPYLKEPMDAVTDPKVRKIVMVAGSQCGKSELELNTIGRIIDQDPGSVLYIHPSIVDARKFSRLRVGPMIRDSKAIKAKVTDIRTKDSGNTILQKSFPGGMLTMTGSSGAAALSSTPSRYAIGDEIDRWADDADGEGDPMELVEARQITFYNWLSMLVSSPTIKGHSKIEDAFYTGTQERWSHQCPECGAFHHLEFNDIKFEHEVVKRKGRQYFKITNIGWACPSCGAFSSESAIKKQPAKWIAHNPDAYNEGIRSFWLSGLYSPWLTWERIIRKFLEAGNNPLKLQPVFNTMLGELWEDRGEMADEDTLMARREEYAAELPDGVLVLTCGVDTQDDRLEYEVVGHGHYGEKWGIKKGFIAGRPDTPEVWERLDDVVDHVYRFKPAAGAAQGVGLTISVTFVDSGGHYTQDVYKACRARVHKKVFAIKGKGGDGIPYVAPASQVKIVDNGAVVGKCWLYTLGVDAGKADIMNAVRVQEKGARYYHFPRDIEEMVRGYDYNYFSGLLSEKLTITRTRRGHQWQWVKLPGHNRNEALDCRNYANAGFKMMDPDLDAVERRLRGTSVPVPAPSQAQQHTPPANKKRRRDLDDMYDDF